MELAEKENGELIKVFEYLKEHKKPKIYCPFCKQELDIKAEKTSDKTAHFWHNKHGQNIFCPIKEKSKEYFPNYINNKIDNNKSKEFKEYFKINAKKIFAQIESLIENYLSLKEFEQIINKANEVNIWGYESLDLLYLPYILSTLNETYERKYQNNNNSFFMFLEPSIQTNYSKWNSQNKKQFIYKYYIKNKSFKKKEIVELNEEIPIFEKNFLKIIKKI